MVPPIDIYVIGIPVMLWGWRWVEKCVCACTCLRKLPTWADAAGRYYSLLYLWLVVELAAQVGSASQYWNAYDALAATDQFPATVVRQQQQLEARPIPDGLRKMSMWGLLPAVVTVLVTGFHILQHVKAHVADVHAGQRAAAGGPPPQALGKGNEFDLPHQPSDPEARGASPQPTTDQGRITGKLNQHRDYAVQLNALPAVYAVLANKGIIRCWSLWTGRLDATEDLPFPAPDVVRATMELQAYRSYYHVIDLYEGWALWCFSALLVQVISAGTDRMGPSYRVPVFTKHLEGLVTFGLRAFAIVCILSSVVSTFIALAWAPPVFSDICAVTRSPCLVLETFTGALFVISCIAVSNIAYLWLVFREPLAEFEPLGKCVCVALLVGIVWIQERLVGILAPSWEAHEVGLAHSTLIVYQSCGLAIAQYFQWDTCSAWLEAPWVRPALDLSAPPPQLEAPAPAPVETSIAKDVRLAQELECRRLQVENEDLRQEVKRLRTSVQLWQGAAADDDPPAVPRNPTLD
mmetsp:Transcript_116464/g.267405  ORF Transcript_116464/g.267405 Transcript_116464/m.267405 type:complete len:520 (-) Transcript_116464:177-1736(-)